MSPRGILATEPLWPHGFWCPRCFLVSQLEKFPMIAIFFQIFQGNVIDACFFATQQKKNCASERFFTFVNIIYQFFSLSNKEGVWLGGSCAVWSLMHFPEGGIPAHPSERSTSSHTLAHTHCLPIAKETSSPCDSKEILFLTCICNSAVRKEGCG